MYASQFSILLSFRFLEKQLRYEYSKGKYITRVMRAKTFDSSVLPRIAPCSRALQIVRSTASFEEDTRHESNMFSGDPHVVELYKDIVVELFLYGRRRVQNLHKT